MADGRPESTLLAVHLMEAGPARALTWPRRRAPLTGAAPGLTWAQPGFTLPLGESGPPLPHGAVLMTGWSDEDALDAFERDAPDELLSGWRVRLSPLRAYGSWSGLPGLGRPEQPMDYDEPVVVITLGRLRIRRALPFLAASRPAERAAAASPATLLMTAVARPPVVCTISVWRTVREMREYATGAHDPAHPEAFEADRRRPFHHESVFARFRPHAARGSWRGLSPLT